METKKLKPNPFRGGKRFGKENVENGVASTPSSKKKSSIMPGVVPDARQRAAQNRPKKLRPSQIRRLERRRIMRSMKVEPEIETGIN